MALDIFITLLLVLLNGFFVAAEFAIVKVRSSQLSLQEGSTSKRAAQLIVNNLDGFLAATQLGITLASLGLGWFGEETVSGIILAAMTLIGVDLEPEVAHRIALPVAFAVITILHIVFGELAPKSLAIRYPTPTALAVSIPLRVFYFIFNPFIKILNGFANLILKIIGIKPASEHEEIHTEKELRLLVAESQLGGEIEQSERELIQNAFDFDDRVVKRVMIPRIKVSGIQVNTSIDDAIRIVLREGYSRYPIYETSLDEITGVVHSKDVVKHYIEKSGKALADITKKAHFISETKRISKLLRDFQKMKIQIAIVVNEYGGTVGIVTLENLIEQLVGDIQDEHDQEAKIVSYVGNKFHVIATSYIREINGFLEHPLPESEDYETLAGLLLQRATSNLIEEGMNFEVVGYEIKILKMRNSVPELVELEYVREEKKE